MSRRAEIQVGLTVLVGIGVLLWGIAFLSAWTKSSGQREWHVMFDQAGGLAEGNEVQVNGIRSGTVKDLVLQGNHVLVTLSLDKSIDLTRGSRIAVRGIGLMGDRVVAIDYRTFGGSYAPGDTILGIYEKGLPEVMAELGGATGGITAISVQLDSIAVAMAKDGGMATTVQNLRRTTEALHMMVSENRATLNSTLANFAATSQTARNLTSAREAQLRKVMDDFSASADNLNRLTMRLDSLRASIQVTASRLEHGDGTIGKLLSDDQLYTGLNKSVRDLQALINDVKAQPKQYFKFSVF